MKRVINWGVNLFILFLVLVIVILVSFKVQASQSPDEIPSIFGYKVLVVLSGSMSPVFDAGDIVVIKDGKKEIAAGDIITFQQEDSFVTHRVEEVTHHGGQAFYTTSGDANNTIDSDVVSNRQVEGIYLWKIPKAGYISQHILQPKGLIIFVLTIVWLFAMGEFYKHFRRKMTAPNEENLS